MDEDSLRILQNGNEEDVCSVLRKFNNKVGMASTCSMAVSLPTACLRGVAISLSVFIWSRLGFHRLIGFDNCVSVEGRIWLIKWVDCNQHETPIDSLSMPAISEQLAPVQQTTICVLSNWAMMMGSVSVILRWWFVSVSSCPTSLLYPTRGRDN